MDIRFYKYQGAGNDFILLDNRSGEYSGLNYQQIARLCDRRFGIGADGFMMLENHERYPFRMAFFNSDGLPGSMCGNGGRCIAAFAYRLGLAPLESPFRFWSSDGEHQAVILSSREGQSLVRLKMRDVVEFAYEASEHVYLIDTGSPHYVKFVDDCQKVNVYEQGRLIRFSSEFPLGTNVDFVEKIPSGLQVRTYERGVEDETFSCGTGVTASAMAFALEEGGGKGEHHVQILTKGGNLSVDFEMERRFVSASSKASDSPPARYPLRFKRMENRRIFNVFLEGLATEVFEGNIRLEDYL